MTGTQGRAQSRGCGGMLHTGCLFMVCSVFFSYNLGPPGQEQMIHCGLDPAVSTIHGENDPQTSLTSQSEGGIFSVEVLFAQMTLACLCQDDKTKQNKKPN